MSRGFRKSDRVRSQELFTWRHTERVDNAGMRNTKEQDDLAENVTEQGGIYAGVQVITQVVRGVMRPDTETRVSDMNTHKT